MLLNTDNCLMNFHHYSKQATTIASKELDRPKGQDDDCSTGDGDWEMASNTSTKSRMDRGWPVGSDSRCWLMPVREDGH
jgi:hypothetical protein